MAERWTERDEALVRSLEAIAQEMPPEHLMPPGLPRRVRLRFVSNLVVSLALVAVATGGGAAAIQRFQDSSAPLPADRPLPTPSAAVTSAPPLPTAPFGVADLTPALLRPTDLREALAGAPSARRFEAYAIETWDATTLESSVYTPADALQRSGFVTSRVSTFATPAWYTGHGKDVVSLALLFPDPEAASRGLWVFDPASPFGAFDQWSRLDASGLGDEGFGTRGRVGDMPTIGYVWRVGNVVLFVASQGSLSPVQLRALADRMATRFG